MKRNLYIPRLARDVAVAGAHVMIEKMEVPDEQKPALLQFFVEALMAAVEGYCAFHDRENDRLRPIRPNDNCGA